MILYHGSNVEIKTIDLAMCRPFKDFGRGFYVTENPEQARNMAKRVSRIYGGKPVVNECFIDDDFMNNKTLNILDFGTKPSYEWAVFVMNNRDKAFSDYGSASCNFDNKYDIVHGPIANDDMAVLFRQFQNGIISTEILVKGLKSDNFVDQYSFHTEKALLLLNNKGVIS